MTDKERVKFLKRKLRDIKEMCDEQIAGKQTGEDAVDWIEQQVRSALRVVTES